jgi:hypothetical protein
MRSFEMKGRDWFALLLPVVVMSVAIHAQNAGDAGTYCKYLIEQAQSQSEFLRTPTASGGMTQPETGLPTQLVGGASLGLSAVRKAGLTMDAARKNCELYRTTSSAQLAIQYATARLEKDALNNRLALIDQASSQLDGLMDKTRQMLEAQNATRLMLFTLETTRIKLDADRADTQSKIAGIYTPAMSDTPLKQLVEQKQENEVAEQESLDKLNRQNNWDVALQVGVHQQVNPVAYSPQPYGAVSVSYNLAGRAIDRHLDRAAAAYGDWKKVEEGDVVRNMEVLRQQIVDGITAQNSKLNDLAREQQELEKNLAAVASPDTSAAVDFNNQLTAALLLLRVETGDATFRATTLKEFLAKNF